MNDATNAAPKTDAELADLMATLPGRISLAELIVELTENFAFRDGYGVTRGQVWTKSHFVRVYFETGACIDIVDENTVRVVTRWRREGGRSRPLRVGPNTIEMLRDQDIQVLASPKSRRAA